MFRNIADYVGCRFAFTCLVVLCSVSGADDLPPELSGFVAIDSNPVFESSPGDWDSLIRERGWVIKDGDQYRMWYTGYNKSESPVTMRMGYATSIDGIHWSRHGQNPIYAESWIEDMTIVRKGETLYMFAEGAKDQPQLLTSTDGVNWTHRGALDVRLVNGEAIPPGPCGTPTVWYEDEIWHLFYERRDQGIWLATSQDLKVWTNVKDDPLIVPGPDNYDKLMIAMNQIVELKGRYYAVMHGTGTPVKPRDWCTYFVVSDDLRNWKKCDNGPVFPVKDNKSSGVLVSEGDSFRLFTMHGKVDLHVPATAP